MKTKLAGFEECLFDAFANEDWGDSQDHRQMWAILEGVRRCNSQSHQWQIVDAARKEHECIRGHVIKAGDTYFLYKITGWGSDWEFCAGCTAMVLPRAGEAKLNIKQAAPAILSALNDGIYQEQAEVLREFVTYIRAGRNGDEIRGEVLVQFALGDVVVDRLETFLV